MGTVNDDIRTANDACFPKVQVNNEAAAYFEPDFSYCDYAEAEQVRIILMMPKYNALHPCYYIREDIISIVERNRDHSHAASWKWSNASTTPVDETLPM